MRTAREWHRYITGAPTYADAQDRIEEAVAAGADFKEMLREQATDNLIARRATASA